MKQLGYWIKAARPKTLPAAAVPVFVGGALAKAGDGFNAMPWVLCMAFALFIQVGTNYANDYYDFIKGADNKDRIGPKRAVASGWIAPTTMRRGMWLTFAAAFLVGCGLIPYGGWILVVIGIASILCGIAYTGGPYPLGYNGLGDIFVFIFFGWVATIFTSYVQTGSYAVDLGTGPSWLYPWLAGMVPGALSTNLLVVNNVRDVEQDRKAGKRTLAVRFGRSFGIRQFVVLNIFAVSVPSLMAVLSHRPWCLLVLLVVPLMAHTIQLIRAASSRDEFQAVLEKTALILMITGILFSVGLAIG